MRHVVIDKPRHKGYDRSRLMHEHNVHATVKKDPDSLPKQGKMSMGYGSKSLSDNLRPLERFLRKNVGRPWDKVWSEISKECPAAGVMQQHIRDHIVQMVETNVRLVEGVPCSLNYTTRGWRPIQSYYWDQLYVCPKTGLLRLAKKKARPKQRRTRPIWISKDTQAHMIDGQWYEIRVAQMSETHRSNPRMVIDIIRGSMLRDYDVFRILIETYGIPGIYGVSKRQLSKRELKKLGLKR